MKVFWSWQSDSPSKIGRYLIRDALKLAIDKLAASSEVRDADRSGSSELHLDSDIQGTTGSPDVVKTIFEKIDESEVVVADVTAVGLVIPTTNTGTEDSAQETTPSETKKLINSNVAVELGYALKAVSSGRLILVFNKHYGRHEDLPFDLRQKGGAITFTLSPSASNEEIKKVQADLSGRFASALRPLLKVRRSPAALLETKSTYDQAVFFKKGEVLAKSGDAEYNEVVEYVFETSRLCYLRMLPGYSLAKPILLAELKHRAQTVPVIKTVSGAIVDHNPHGAIRLEPKTYPPNGRASINSATQLFENGEIWTITSTLIQRRGGNASDFLHCTSFEETYRNTLTAFCRFTREHIGEADMPWVVEFGMTGIQDIELAVYPHTEGWGPIRKPQIWKRIPLRQLNPSFVDRALLDFFGAVYDLTGRHRPKGLYGFPAQ